MKRTALVLFVSTLFAVETNAGTPEQLAAYRGQIDLVDRQIVELFQQRARVVEDIADFKRKMHLPVMDTGREQQVIEKVQKLAKDGPLPAEAVGRIYKKLIEEMRDWEARVHPAVPQS
jgi:chorismate mutase